LGVDERHFAEFPAILAMPPLAGYIISVE